MIDEDAYLKNLNWELKALMSCTSP